MAGKIPPLFQVLGEGIIVLGTPGALSSELVSSTKKRGKELRQMLRAKATGGRLLRKESYSIFYVCMIH